MARIAGDNNLSLREKRKDAQIVALKAEIETQKAKTKVVVARNRELQEKLKEKRPAKLVKPANKITKPSK